MEEIMPTQSQPQAKPTIPQLLPVFQELLPVKVIRALIGASGQRFYERLFTPLVVVWGFIYQRLNSDHTCDAALSYLASGAVDHLDDRHESPLSERIKSESTAAYCKGRWRLPLSVLQGALRHTAATIGQGLGDAGRWLGHHVGLLDGTTLLLRPEAELVAHYGRHTNQHGQSYWVVMRAVVAFCLASGAALGVTEGSLHASEQELAALLLAQAVQDSVYVGDSNFGVFSVVQAARHYGVWMVVRLTRSRARALAGRKMHPGEDRRVAWSPSAQDQLHADMSAAPIEGRLIYVRLERPGFRPVSLYLFTTLLHAQPYSVEELVKLYAQRWHAELNLRYVKDTLDMALLTSKSVAMVRKELHAGLLAYNIIRGYMAQAAQQAGLSPLALSFTRGWRRVRDLLLTCRPTDPADRIAQAVQRLLTRLARCQLPKRPRFRVEPRAVRRRPVSYPNLKGSRAEARQRLIEQMKEPAKS
jgi:hypothetical protein